MPEDVRALYDRHVAAVVANDIEAIVAGYAEDATIMGPTGNGQGHDGVRAAFAAATGIMADLQPEVTLAIEGDVVLAVWRSGPGAPAPAAGADTFVFRDGLIIAHTSARLDR